MGRPGAAQTSHLGPAILHAMEDLAVHRLDVAALFGNSSISPEEACAQVSPAHYVPPSHPKKPAVTSAGGAVRLWHSTVKYASCESDVAIL